MIGLAFMIELIRGPQRPELMFTTLYSSEALPLPLELSTVQSV